MLEELGLPAAAASVYRLLVTTPSAAASDVGHALGMGGEEVAAALDTLEQYALASRTEVGGEARWTAVPPLLTGQRLLVERAQRLLAAQQELLGLAVAHERTARAGGAENLVEIVLGEQAVHAQVRRLQEGTSEEILALVKPPFVAVPHEEAAGGIMPPRSRVVYDESIFSERDGLLEVIRRTARPGVRHRVHPSVPMRLQIYDQRVAAMPLVRHDAQQGVLVVRPSGLLAMAVALFEATWSQAVPLPVADTGPGQVLNAEDRRVLGLLLGGLTDETIAHQLDRSLRWVQRRVRLMMDAAGVRTRLQLGWQAHRRGWLADDTAAGHPRPGISAADPAG